ncbi:uncharacterized protein LACBIDRAFT_307218 [Laccaria bicolor S238N-H82]|uniref:Predicted protein n=1 Tax=Laccaria bicolor (strain S238N-H82 / ATCC MYA-4686) TaxID=486041 RepID=B0DPN7_LACBS|nr:uncharacterized protein LACBIDRAFT_307218 [Laccaria bicolor S238N-H82]EDR03482.1 predicted protein [Laccaria bicolor S238N-H82]|eukprot:XP_001885938.1 predicted protein [Laccaria bicolor S238N-H82]
MPDHTQNTVGVQLRRAIDTPDLILFTQWPPELTHNVLTYLDSDDVARVARVGNTFQAEAGRLLSRRRANWEKSLWKPDMYELIIDRDFTTAEPVQGRLQELIFWYPPKDTLDTWDTLVTDQLQEGLLLMTSLKHLTIRLPANPEFDVLETINSTFTRCTFSLKTLYLSEDFELFPWILKQTELEIMAVYTPSWFWGFNKDKHLSDQRWLSSSPCFRIPPTLFILSGVTEDGISAFPAFSPGWSAKLIDDSLKHFYAIPQKDVTMIALYVQTMDEFDDKNVLSAVRSISDHFVNIFHLDVYVGDCMIHLNPEALASVLSNFTRKLQELAIVFWEEPSNDNRPVAYFFRDQKLKLCKVWSEECPSLAYINFPDHSGRAMDSRWEM